MGAGCLKKTRPLPGASGPGLWAARQDPVVSLRLQWVSFSLRFSLKQREFLIKPRGLQEDRAGTQGPRDGTDSSASLQESEGVCMEPHHAHHAHHAHQTHTRHTHTHHIHHAHTTPNAHETLLTCVCGMCVVYEYVRCVCVLYVCDVSGMWCTYMCVCVVHVCAVRVWCVYVVCGMYVVCVYGPYACGPCVWCVVRVVCVCGVVCVVCV